MELGTLTEQQLIDWNGRADAFCRARSSEEGRPDYDALSKFYAPDTDVVIYDTLPPLDGFRGFEQMRHTIYPGLALIRVRRTGPLTVKSLCEGNVVVTNYQFHLKYGFSDGTGYDIDARMSEVWVRRDGAYVIVHEHPSTTYDPPALPSGR